MSLWGNFTTIKNQVKSLKQVADLIAGRAPGPKPNNPLMRQPPVTVPEEEGREQMPCVTFAGVFSERRSYGKFLRHSGLVTVDYENLKDRNKTPEGWKNRAAGRMPGLAMAFTTPSKDGVKLVIQVHPKPAGKEEHQLAFLRAVQELEKLGMEGWNCNGQDMRAVSFLPRDTRIQLSDGVEPLRWSAG